MRNVNNIIINLNFCDKCEFLLDWVFIVVIFIVIGVVVVKYYVNFIWCGSDNWRGKEVKK